MANNDYLDSINKLARKKQLNLSKQQTQDLLKIYEQASHEYFRKFASAKDNTATKALLSEYTYQLNSKLKNLILEYNLQVCEAQAELISMGTNKLLFIDALGLDTPQGKGMLQRLTNVLYDKTTETFLLGNIYKDGKGLSQRIWDACNASGQKIEMVVGTCLAMQLSAVETSKVLESFMNPNYKGVKWSRSKIKQILGPGYGAWNKDISYEALRLARTTLSHASTIALKHGAKLNPYLTNCVWHSVHAVGRTCPTCTERDGKTFKIDKVPFDHPNGLCWQEPILDKTIEEIGAELEDWLAGKPNARLTKWEDHLNKNAKALGIKWNPTVKPKNAPKEYRQFTRQDVVDMELVGKQWSDKLSAEEKNAVYKYTGSGYSAWNNYLRHGTIPDNDVDYLFECKDNISLLEKALKKFTLKEDIMAYRGTDLDAFYHSGFADVYESMLMLSSGSDDYDEELKRIKDRLTGEMYVDQGFMSTSIMSTSAFSRNVMFNIKIDKGFYGGAFVKDLSQFKNEHEFLLNKGTGLLIENVDFVDDKWIITAKAVAGAL